MSKRCACCMQLIVVVCRQNAANIGKTEPTSNGEYKKSFGLQCIKQMLSSSVDVTINPHLDAKVPFYKKINPEIPASAGNAIHVNEMGEYVNVKTEANWNQPEENPYIEPNEANPYLIPDIPK